MALYNGFYTRQQQEDAFVTHISNPNRVGSGFINLGPQKRFASPTTSWQLGGGPPPLPFTDIRNTPRPSSNGPQPPPAQPVSNTSNKDVAIAALPTHKTKAGMLLTEQQPDTPAAVPVEVVAAVSAQLAEDEALAQMLQHAPPEPVAALAEQRADAANHVPPAPQPASRTPAPSEATTDDTTAKRVRALRKKVRDIEAIEEKQREGAILQQAQLDKIAGKAAIVKELGAIACDTTEKQQGALTDDTTAKRVRALRKKVRDIEALEEKQREGVILQQNQLDKIAGKAAIVKELGALLV